MYMYSFGHVKIYYLYIQHLTVSSACGNLLTKENYNNGCNSKKIKFENAYGVTRSRVN